MVAKTRLVIEDGPVLVEELEEALGPLSRALGLMGRAGMAPRGGLWLEPCSSIHMMFVRFPIDVVWLDSQNTVLKISSGVRSWIGLAACLSARVALELPSGNAAGVKVGDRLLRVSADE